MIRKLVIVLVVMGQALAPLLTHAGILSLRLYAFYATICFCVCTFVWFGERLGRLAALVLIGMQSVVVSANTFSWCLICGHAVGAGISYNGGSWLLANIVSFYTSGFTFGLSIGRGSEILPAQYKLAADSDTVMFNVTAIISFFVILAATKSAPKRSKSDLSVAA